MQEKAGLDESLALMKDLRQRCDWDAAQTHESLRPYLNEEMHELDDALREGHDAAICGELGDVLLQVLFHTVIAEERGAFGPQHVAGSLVAKMTRRHPWLFGRQVADAGYQPRGITLTRRPRVSVVTTCIARPAIG